MIEDFKEHRFIFKLHGIGQKNHSVKLNGSILVLVFEVSNLIKVNYLPLYLSYVLLQLMSR